MIKDHFAYSSIKTNVVCTHLLCNCKGFVYEYQKLKFFRKIDKNIHQLSPNTKTLIKVLNQVLLVFSPNFLNKYFLL